MRSQFVKIKNLIIQRAFILFLAVGICVSFAAAQSNTVFYGGSGNGNAKTCYTAPGYVPPAGTTVNSVFYGGSGSGNAKTCYVQPGYVPPAGTTSNAIVKGGNYAGYVMSCLGNYYTLENCPSATSVTVSSITATNASCATSTDGTATVTAAQGTTPYTYRWTAAQTTQTASNLAPGTYTVVVTDNQAPLHCQAKASVVVGANSAVANITGTTTICIGNSTTLTASAGDSYSWLPGGETTQGITVNPSSTTAYSVTVTTGACTAGANATVTVNPLPQGSLTANGPFCASGAGTLTWTATTGTGPYTVVYNDGVANRTKNGAISGTAFAVFTTPVTSTTTYTLVSVQDANCTRSSGFTGSSATITIIPLPQGSLTTASGPFCGSGAGTLTWTATTGTGPYIVIYNDGVANRTQNNVTSGTPFAVFTTPVTSTTTYTLVSVQDANCTRSSGFTGSSATITVNPLPQGSLTANGPFCVSGAGTLTWTATTGTGPYTVIYNDGVADRTQNNVTSGTAFNVFTNPVTSNTTYTLVSVQDVNCIRSSGFTGSSATITINPLPQGSLTTASGPFCGSGAGTLTWTATTGTGPYTVIYNDGVADRTKNGAISGTAFGVFTTPVTSTTTYTLVSVQDANCTRSSGFTGSSATITVNPLPFVSISGGLLIYQGDATTLTATSGYTYLWSTTETTQGITVSPVSTTAYSVTATNGFGCTNNASVTVTVLDPANKSIFCGGSYAGNAFSCYESGSDATPLPSVNNGIYAGGGYAGTAKSCGQSGTDAVPLPSVNNTVFGGSSGGGSIVLCYTDPGYTAPVFASTNTVSFRGGVLDGECKACSDRYTDLSGLPITLLYFTAVLNGEVVKTEWATAVEINNDYFTVEKHRGTDSLSSEKSWDEVGRVKGAGNSRSTLYYALTDQNPYTGLSYYRLKQTDYDGKYSYSQMVPITIRGIDLIAILPNPAEDKFEYVVSSSENTKVEVQTIDVLGRKIISQSQSIKEGINKFTLDISKLAEGIYVLQINTESGLYKTYKQFVKN